MSSTIGGASLLKEINRNVILNEIRINGPMSRADLVATTGLRFPTVIRIVDALVEDNIIQEIGKGETASGRKPTMLAINPEAAYIVGVVVGLKMIVVLTDFLGNIIDENIESMELQNGPEYVADIAYKQVSAILLKNNLNFDEIAGIGIATPGMDFKTSIGCEDPKTLACWHSADTSEIFYKKFKGSLVKIGMLPVCGAIGEQWFGKTKNSKNNIYVYVDKGVGAGVIVDGKTYLGKDGFAGHIGHMTIDMNGPLCYCGNKGCLETFTSSIYIISKVREKIAEGAPSLLNEIVQGDISKIKFNSIVLAANKGDQVCLEVLNDAGIALGIGLANAINSFNPDTVVFGGEVCWSCPTLVETAITVARRNIFSNRARVVEMLVSSLNFRSEAKGAVALIMNEVFRSPDL